jgi:ATP-dependent DNA ligase
MKTNISLLLNHRVQAYKNLDTHLQPASRWDIVQLKYDGWWARVVIESGVARIFSRQNQLKDTFPAPGVKDMILIGEYLKGTNRATSAASSVDVAGCVMVFDALETACHSHEKLMKLPYEDRHNLVMALHVSGKFPAWCFGAPAWGVEQAGQLWDNDVLAGGAEGLVFRKLHHTYVDSVIGRVKKEFTMDYVATDVVEGAGKRSGMTGAIIGSLYENGVLVPKVRVGGGFDNAQAIDIYTNFEAYRGRVMEVKGWQVFDSGAMRHPNLVKWREDKIAADCIWPLA